MQIIKMIILANPRERIQEDETEEGEGRRRREKEMKK